MFQWQARRLRFSNMKFFSFFIYLFSPASPRRYSTKIRWTYFDCDWAYLFPICDRNLPSEINSRSKILWQEKINIQADYFFVKSTFFLYVYALDTFPLLEVTFSSVSSVPENISVKAKFSFNPVPSLTCYTVWLSELTTRQYAVKHKPSSLLYVRDLWHLTSDLF
jgi:hypothetical protein